MCLCRRIKWVKRAASGMYSTHEQHIALKRALRLCLTFHNPFYMQHVGVNVLIWHSSILTWYFCCSLHSKPLLLAPFTFSVLYLSHLPADTAAGPQMCIFCLAHTHTFVLLLFCLLLGPSHHALTLLLAQLDLVLNPQTDPNGLRSPLFMLTYKNPCWHECLKL